MDICHAKELLTVLADGINPLTGEVLPSSDSCNQVEVVRALHAILKYLDSQNQKTEIQQPKNAGKPWSKKKKNILINEYNAGFKINEIAKKHKRSNGAIEAKLVQMGLIDKSIL